MIGHTLDDPWAPHPIVNRHICYGGGGGGGGSESNAWDPTQYVTAMSNIGNKLGGYGDDIIKWAKEQGIKLEGIADTVGTRAGELADAGVETYKEQMAKWKEQYAPLYEAQSRDAQRMIGELPRTEEQYAGKYGADVAQAFDASREAQERSLRSYGLKNPSGGSARLDGMVDNQRRLGQVAAAEKGRMDARNEARGVAANAIQTGLALPQIAGQGSALGLAGGNQELGARTAAASTGAGLYSPGLQAHQIGSDAMKEWGKAWQTNSNQKIAEANAAAQEGGGGIGGMLGGLAGTVAGSFLGPMGGAIGGQAGSAIAGSLFEEGGPVEGDQMVDPSMSQSQGAITDDVPARLNVGEFVMPKDVVEWRGEAWMQKEIMKARKEREQNTVAEPEMGQMSAIDMQAPQFQSGETSL